MLRRRLAAPSPAFVVSLVALFFALGGASYAAGNAVLSTHPDAKADTKLVKVLARSLSVKNANELGGKPASAYVQKSAKVTGNWSCAGTAFEPASSAETYDLSGSEKFSTSGAALFRCSVDLPDGAIVTAITFGIKDNSGDNASCDMWRTNMASSIGGETLMGTVSSSGAPGPAQITTTSISAPVIDNANYTYFVQCYLVGSDNTLGLYGANVAYHVAAQHAARRIPSTKPSPSSGSSSR
jgi:hypothetical protein